MLLNCVCTCKSPTFCMTLNMEELKISMHLFDHVVLITIPGGPEITEQSIQSIFQDFALINSYFLRLVG